jgi:predicted nucleic acid-binding protein
MIVFLDTSILGIVTNPESRGETGECKRWYETLLVRGARIVTSEICAYEKKRGLLKQSLKQGRNVGGLQKLEELRNGIEFLPVTKEVLDEAAQVWAEAMYQNQPMTQPSRLDADAIICAHWRLLDKDNPGRAVVIATTNLRDLNRFTVAAMWSNIRL